MNMEVLDVCHPCTCLYSLCCLSTDNICLPGKLFAHSQLKDANNHNIGSQKYNIHIIPRLQGSLY
jgi:hypothetical protein